MTREPVKHGDEWDWVSRRARRLLKVFTNRTGLGRAVKRAINNRYGAWTPGLIETAGAWLRGQG